MERRCWLVKTEPESFSIDALARVGRTMWDGVRNYQARNYMRDGMRVGDEVLVYHSNASPPGVAGIARVASAAYPDPTAFDPNDHHYDPDSKPDDPRWLLVDLEFVEKLPALVTLDGMKEDPALDGMMILRKGNRLSITPVEPAHYDHIVAVGRALR